MKTINLYTKIRFLPEQLRSEVNDFVDLLIMKKNIKSPKNQPKFGSLKGKIHLTDDFDDPLEDFKEFTE